MKTTYRTLATGVLLGVALHVHAQIEKRDVHIAVGGKTALYYLPLTLTERLGYFKDEGLNVRISDFPGGTRSLEAVLRGRAPPGGRAPQHTHQQPGPPQDLPGVVPSPRAPPNPSGDPPQTPAA